MHLTATLTSSAATAVPLTLTDGTARGLAGLLLDLDVISSVDTSVAFSISDETGVVFTITSTDFTTITKYKNGDSAIVRNSVTGQLKATATGLGSGTLIINAWVKPDRPVG